MFAVFDAGGVRILTAAMYFYHSMLYSLCRSVDVGRA